MNRNNKTKNLIINALLLGIGAILHQITPALGIPMQPDFALAMLLIVMIINKGEYKTSLIAGIITGIFTALTTKFPMGQMPNIIDKIVTVNIVYVGMILTNKLLKNRVLTNTIQMAIVMIILAIGTLISGSVFLLSASLLVGLPVAFNILFITVVLPTVLVNSIAGVVLYKIVSTSLKRVLNI